MNYMKEDDIKWHPAFVAAIQLEFRAYEKYLEFSVEHELTQEPLRIDVVVIKKVNEIEINKGIGKIFRKYNVFEYKSPTDYISIDDFYKVKAYTYLYKSLNGRTNEIDIDDMTITLTSARKPNKLLKYLLNKGCYISNENPGIYNIEGADVRMQLIVSKELNDDEAKYLKLLQIEHKNQKLLEAWMIEYMLNARDPLYKIIMNVLNNSNPDKIVEVYKNMAIPKISEENMKFLMNEIRLLEIDKRLMAQAKSNLLVKQLSKKFSNLPDTYIDKIMNLSQEQIDVIGENIFELEKIEDIDKYLNN